MALMTYTKIMASHGRELPTTGARSRKPFAKIDKNALLSSYTTKIKQKDHFNALSRDCLRHCKMLQSLFYFCSLFLKTWLYFNVFSNQLSEPKPNSLRTKTVEGVICSSLCNEVAAPSHVWSMFVLVFSSLPHCTITNACHSLVYGDLLLFRVRRWHFLLKWRRIATKVGLSMLPRRTLQVALLHKGTCNGKMKCLAQSSRYIEPWL